jgi:hypothetical protein
MPDSFPEAFRRYEEVVDVSKFDSYRELFYSFAYWSGPRRWKDSYPQNLALVKEAKRLGFKDAELPRYFRRASTAWKSSAKYGQHRGMKDKQISIVNDAIREGYSANKIQAELREHGLGIRRKVLLQNIREMKMKSAKTNAKKYTPRKYRK